MENAGRKMVKEVAALAGGSSYDSILEIDACTSIARELVSLLSLSVDLNSIPMWHVSRLWLDLIGKQATTKLRTQHHYNLKSRDNLILIK